MQNFMELKILKDKDLTLSLKKIEIVLLLQEVKILWML